MKYQEEWCYMIHPHSNDDGEAAFTCKAVRFPINPMGKPLIHWVVREPMQWDDMIRNLEAYVM